MRRTLQAVSLALAGLALSASSAWASPIWTNLQPLPQYRYGYSDPAPPTFALRSVLKAYIGAGYDGSSETSAWAKTVQTDSTGFAAFSGTDTGQVQTQDLGYTVQQGDDFAFVLAYSHAKDGAVGRTGYGQYATLGVSSTTLTNSSAMRSGVRNDNAARTGGVYYYGSEYISPAISKLRDQEGYTPAARRQAYRTVVSIVGKWDPGTSKWRVRSRWFEDDGDHQKGGSNEATFTPSGGTLTVKNRIYAVPNGTLWKESKSSTDQPTVDSRAESGVSVTNLESLEAAVTTDSAAVAAAWDKTPSAGSLAALPVEGIGSDGLPTDSNGGGFLGDFWGKFRGWLSQLSDIFWPLEVFKEVGKDPNS